MNKVLNAVGNFFKKVWNWFLENAWIQVLLIVGIIFGIIFSLQPISNAIRDAIEAGKESKWYENHQILWSKSDEDKSGSIYIDEKVKAKEEFVVIFMSPTCTNCETLEPKVESLLKEESMKDYKVYALDITNENFQKDFVLTAFEQITAVYDTLPTDDRHPDYLTVDTWKDSIPTPCLVKFNGDGVSKVTLGVSTTDVYSDLISFIKKN